MKRKIKWLVAGALAVAFVACVSFLSAPKNEPRHNGKLLSEWLSDLLSTNLVERAAAKEAVRAMGAEAVPYLTNALAANPGWDKKRATIIKALPQFVWRSARARELVSPSWYRRTESLVAFKEIGPAASNAIPAIIASDDRVFGPWFKWGPRIDALVAIGPVSIPPLVNELTGKHNGRILAMRTLGEFGQEAQVALPLLVKILREGFVQERPLAEAAIRKIGFPSAPTVTNMVVEGATREDKIAAARLLAHFGSKAESATNVLAAATRDADPAVRAQAIYSLGHINALESFYIPLIAPLLKDTDAKVRLAAAHNIARFDDALRENWEAMEALRNDPNEEIRRLVKRELALKIRLKP